MNTEVLDKNAAYDELKKNKQGLTHISFSMAIDYVYQKCYHKIYYQS